MTRLTDYADNTHSQFGEDGIIAHLFHRLGVQARVAVEFGAGDGLSCSNTAALWRGPRWKTLLIEPDPARFGALTANASSYNTILLQEYVTPTGPNSIGELVAAHGLTTIDFMSIDVDGDDYFILEALTCRPRVICIEFNPTIPSHIELRGDAPGNTMGASLLAMVRLAALVGYRFVGATHCNAFLVIDAEAAAFDGYEADPVALFPASNYTYAITDFAGRVVLAGQALPWAAREPYVLPLVASCYISPITDDLQYLRRGFEARWGTAVWLNAPDVTADALLALLRETGPPLVLLDLTYGGLAPDTWMRVGTEAPAYRAVTAGTLLGLVRQDLP